MDFNFTPEQQLFRQSVREFADRYVRPHIKEMEACGMTMLLSVSDMKQALTVEEVIDLPERGFLGIGQGSLDMLPRPAPFVLQDRGLCASCLLQSKTWERWRSRLCLHLGIITIESSQQSSPPRDPQLRGLQNVHGLGPAAPLPRRSSLLHGGGTSGVNRDIIAAALWPQPSGLQRSALDRERD